MSPQLVTCMQSLAPTFTPTQCIHCIRPQSRLLKVDGLKTAGKYSSTRGSFLPLLLPECLCLWACVCVWVCMDMYDGMMVYGGQSSLSSIFLRVTHFFFPDKVSQISGTYQVVHPRDLSVVASPGLGLHVPATMSGLVHGFQEIELRSFVVAQSTPFCLTSQFYKRQCPFLDDKEPRISGLAPQMPGCGCVGGVYWILEPHWGHVPGPGFHAHW